MKSWVNPKWRVAAFLILVNVGWMFAAWAWVERENWLWITPIALSINFLLLTYDQVLNFSRLETQALVGHDSWGLLKTVHQLCERFQLTEPKVFLIDHSSAQVFAYARTRRQSRLFISEGALRLLKPRELEAVLLYQLLAIDRSLSVLNYWMGAVLDLCYRGGRALEKCFAFIFGWSPHLASWLIKPVMWLMHVFLLSARDFQKLDRETASKIAHPEDLARALWKMESYAQTQPWNDALIFAHMCMVSPLRWRMLQNFLRVQPPLKKRIKSLTGHYPL